MTRRLPRHRTPSQIRRPALAYLLDKFSQADLRTWQKMADGLEQYNVRLFYHLEGLRQVHHTELIRALSSCKPTVVNLHYAERFGGPMIAAAGAFSGQEYALRRPGSFSAVRLSGEVHQIFDLREARVLERFVDIVRGFPMPDDLKQLAKELANQPPWLITKSSQLRRTLLARDWRAWPVQHGIPANSQVFGRLLLEAGFERVVYLFARGRSLPRSFPYRFGCQRFPRRAG